MISLDTLLSSLAIKEVPNLGEKPVFNRVTSNTRLLREGDLFIAVPGENFTTDDLIQKAIDLGTRFIVAEENHAPVSQAYILPTKDIHSTKAMLCHLFYPQQPQHQVAVTGTNGKTSTVNFLRQLWEMDGLPAATIGTFGIQSSVPLPIDYDFEPMTTPHATMFYEVLNACAQEGINHLAFEATSHALAQKRLGPFQVPVGIFTNLTRDHLDYHKTMEAYGEAKKMLFANHLHEKGTAILHYQLPFFNELADICKARGIRVLSYGIEGADAKYTRLSYNTQEQHIAFDICGQQWESTVPLIGTFQIDNLLAALTAFKALGSNPATLPLGAINYVEGRLECVGTTTEGAHVYVDFAHTPDALEKALLQLRPFTQHKLGVIFGCGGERDRGKRKIMGEIATRYSDWVIVTDDNPRHEDAACIRQEILAGCPHACESTPREEAIAMGISRLKAGDLLLIAGKGHEATQVIGDQKMAFSDKAWAQKILQQQRGSRDTK